MAKTILIGCKLPNGIILEVNEKQIELNGLSKTVIIGATHATTAIDADFWQAWKSQNATFSALKNGAIFEAANEVEAVAIAKDTDKTGLEPMKQDAQGVKKAKD